MSKLWFIFLNDRHLGPFNYKDIEIRFSAKKIDGDTLVWREGEATWNPMKNTPAFHQLLGIKEVALELEPEIELETEEEFIPSIPQEDIEEEKGPPELPPTPQDEELPPIPQEEIAPEEEIIDEEPPAEIVQLANETNQGNCGRGMKIIKIVMGALSLIVLLAWLSFFMFSASVEIPGKGLSPSDYQRLMKIVKVKSVKPRFELALSTNHKYFVLASNYDHSATIYLTLSSFSGKVLAKEKVQISSIAQMNDNVAIFKDLRLEDSDRIEKGLYMLKVRGLNTGLRIKFLKALRNLEVFNFIKCIREVNDHFLYRGEFILGFAGLDSFQSALKKYKTEEKKRRLLPVQEVLERYRTYHSILKRLNELLGKTLIEFNKRGAVKRFERTYINEIAPIYQTLTVENKKIQISLIESDSELSKEYQRLVNFGKQIGVLVSQMTGKLNQYRKLRKKSRLKLLREFQGKLNELEELGKMRIHKIEEQLSSL
ncbi:MAG: DUF4339 domain-containing protein [Bacteriovoracaceae bacterium]|nr:DUF4339 domain-containing protein [Bacteriovoracaceae bacterium]